MMKTLVKKIRKGLQIGVLGTALAAGTLTSVGCAQTVENFDSATEIPDNATNVRTDQPYTRKIGNGNYFFHNFMGEDTKNIQDYTVHQDVTNYLAQGESFVQTLAENFAETLDDRPALQKYFARLLNNTLQTTLPQKVPNIDNTVNRIAAPCRQIMADVVQNLDRAEDRSALKLCYATLSNETYREGLGEARAEQTPETEKYERRKNAILADWVDHPTLRTTNFCRDVETNACHQITDHLDTLLKRAVRNMAADPDYAELTASDLRRVVNIALTTDALAAMHDTTATAMRHRYCTMEIGIVNAMGSTAQNVRTAQDFTREL